MDKDIVIKRYAFFKTRGVKRKLIGLIKECSTEIEASARIQESYPYISALDAMFIAENFNKELKKI